MRRALARIRARWGEPATEPRDVELVAKLFKLTELQSDAIALLERSGFPAEIVEAADALAASD